MKIFAIYLLMGLNHFAFASVTTEVGYYQPNSGLKLYYVLGIPDTSTTKVFIFVGGDGSNCRNVPSQMIAQMMKAAPLKDIIVSPQTARDALCDSGKFTELDFFHRIDEVKTIVRQLRTDSRFVHFDFYLMGYSAGADIVSLAAKEITGLKGIILIAGGGTPLKEAWITRALLQGFESGNSEADIKKEIDRLLDIFKKIESECLTSVASWDDRSNLFWCQLLNSSIENNLQNLDPNLPILLIHGRKDTTVRIEETYRLYAKLITNHRKIEMKIFPEMDHSFKVVVPEILETISKWAQ